jgi:hypothetical protein
MTAIAKRKTVIRAETSSTIRGRALMIELTPYTVRLREKGRRTWFETTWESVYLQAAMKAADQLRAERKRKRTTLRQRG